MLTICTPQLLWQKFVLMAIDILSGVDVGSLGRPCDQSQSIEMFMDMAKESLQNHNRSNILPWMPESRNADTTVDD